MTLPALTLYTRPGCGLCDLACTNLEAMGFTFQRVNVDLDPDLRRRFGDDVPVLAAGERVLGKGSFSRARLGSLKLLLMRGSPPS